MKTININKQEGVKFILFPDNQPHVIVENIEDGDTVKVICALNDSLTVMHLLQVSNAIANAGAFKVELHIPYLMGARYDRLMQKGDSFDLEVISELINSCKFEKVFLYDVHSEVALKLISNAVSYTNTKLVKEYQTPNSVLICPDKGAKRNIEHLMQWNANLVDVVYCEKERNLSTGALTLTVLEPEKCLGRDCVIIDDLCDGGGTFMMIAEQIQPESLTLIVTHGIFSKGFSQLKEYFNRIITSNTYRSHYDSPIVEVVDIID